MSTQPYFSQAWTQYCLIKPSHIGPVTNTVKRETPCWVYLIFGNAIVEQLPFWCRGDLYILPYQTLTLPVGPVCKRAPTWPQLVKLNLNFHLFQNFDFFGIFMSNVSPPPVFCSTCTCTCTLQYILFPIMRTEKLLLRLEQSENELFQKNILAICVDKLILIL